MDNTNIQSVDETFVRRRSLLFMPGDSARKIEKATSLPADCIIADLEDGVALNRKQAARDTVVEAFSTLDFGPRERLIRINPVDSALWEEDLRQTIQVHPDGYVVPKVQYGDQVRTLSLMLAALEEAQGWPVGAIRLLLLVETALGVMNLAEIARADRRVTALLFGAEDLAGDMGARRTRDGWEILYARSALVTAAAAYGLQAIDTVFVDLTDLEGLAEECRFVRNLGYTGKLAIHPRQVEVINDAFTPSPEEVEAARRLIAAFEAHQASGTGAFELDGRMVDMPMVRAARKVLAYA
ncbi:MAG: CoA ester lyase [Caldilineae bacterium]|nr:MAG: CoA ester lyase [Caldilineae bacterium]